MHYPLRLQVVECEIGVGKLNAAHFKIRRLFNARLARGFRARVALQKIVDARKHRQRQIAIELERALVVIVYVTLDFGFVLVGVKKQRKRDEAECKNTQHDTEPDQDLLHHGELSWSM